MQSSIQQRGVVSTRTMLHESIPSAQDCQRTVVRLNVPGWLPPEMVNARQKARQPMIDCGMQSM